MEPLKVIWRTHEIGEFTDYTWSDWFVEGRWIPNNAKEAKSFEKTVKGFDPRQVLIDPQRAIRVWLKPADPEKQSIYTSVVGLGPDGRLKLRNLSER